MSIEQYFKTKVPSEDMQNDDIESSDMDSDLEETHIELSNEQTQNKLNSKKKKVHLLSKKKTGAFQKEWLEFYKWLIYDGTKNLMFCSLCQFHKKQNRFGKEGNNIIFLTFNLYFFLFILTKTN